MENCSYIRFGNTDTKGGGGYHCIEFIFTPLVYQTLTVF